MKQGIFFGIILAMIYINISLFLITLTSRKYLKRETIVYQEKIVEVCDKKVQIVERECDWTDIPAINSSDFE